MRLQRPKSGIIQTMPYEVMVNNAALVAGLTCAKKPPDEGGESFIRSRIKDGNDRPLDHLSISCYLEIDSGTAQLVLDTDFTQAIEAATDLCLVDGHISFVIPDHLDIEEGVYTPKIMPVGIDSEELGFVKDLLNQEESIKSNQMIKLNGSILTRVVATATLREWRFLMRFYGNYVPNVTQPLLRLFKEEYPVFFEDIN